MCATSIALLRRSADIGFVAAFKQTLPRRDLNIEESVAGLTRDSVERLEQAAVLLRSKLGYRS